MSVFKEIFGIGLCCKNCKYAVDIAGTLVHCKRYDISLTPFMMCDYIELKEVSE